jgi:hypothetical protein
MIGAVKFAGFEEPTENWSKLPHALIGALGLMTSESEIKVVLYILRHTWGYHDDSKRISLDEFANGRKKSKAGRIDAGTGLSVNAVKDGLRRAIQHGFIVVQEDTRDKGRITRTYSLNMLGVSEVDTPDVGGQSLIVSKSDNQPSEVDGQPSDFDSRTWKDTLETNLEKETVTPSSDPVMEIQSGKKTVTEAEPYSGAEAVSDEAETDKGMSETVPSPAMEILPTIKPDACTGKGGAVVPKVAKPSKRNGNQASVGPGGDDRSPASTTREIQDAFVALTQEYEKYEIKNWAEGESVAAKRIAVSHTPDELRAVYKHYKSQAFWKDKHLTLRYIASQIGGCLAYLRKTHVIKEESDATSSIAGGNGGSGGAGSAGTPGGYGIDQATIDALRQSQANIRARIAADASAGAGVR